ncbi:zinc finger CCCH domain-containing protein 43 [Senna tora]|uniref:Zinc finger CCCH domain-containing protein 43 n=1 Tax=Senna tora TaxID=362788 RepID=A0A835CDD2_9FABA|nr:zinc finger CCCH domain-containing protein 43 [Senna tora]
MRMESSESQSSAISNSNENLELGFRSAPSFPNSDHDTETSDLNHQAEADALHVEFPNKLVLNDKEGRGETDKEDFEFDGSEEVCNKADAEESDKGDGWSEDDGNWNENEDGDWNENVNDGDDDEIGRDFDVSGDEVERREERSNGRNHHYPLRPEADDCAFYLKTGTCKFGFYCKFNHPVRKKDQAGKEKAGERDESADRAGQTECKYYLTSGGCKFGKACKYNHTRGKCSASPILELNFLGLPIRLGEKECPYYMRTGSCKFGASCKFNHPDPTTVGGGDPSTGFGNGGPISLQSISQPSVPSWSSQRTLNETAAYVPMVLSPTQGVSPRSSEWNGYQFPPCNAINMTTVDAAGSKFFLKPVKFTFLLGRDGGENILFHLLLFDLSLFCKKAPLYLAERSMHPPPAYVMNNSAIETSIFMHHQKQMQVEEFPERPGEPECSYFLKTGDCKFKSSCKFHHPRNRITKVPPTCTLSDKGLPLRPDQNICTHYSRYGICKFGPACKFDHPINPSPSTMPAIDQQSSYSNSATVEVTGMAGNEGQVMQ